MAVTSIDSSALLAYASDASIVEEQVEGNAEFLEEPVEAAQVEEDLYGDFSLEDELVIGEEKDN